MKVIITKYCKNGDVVLASRIESSSRPDLTERRNRADERARRKIRVKLYAARFNEGRPIFDE